MAYFAERRWTCLKKCQVSPKPLKGNESHHFIYTQVKEVVFEEGSVPAVISLSVGKEQSGHIWKLKSFKQH